MEKSESLKAQLASYTKGYEFGRECKVEFLHEFVNRFTEIEISLPAIKHVYEEIERNKKDNKKG